MNTDPRTLIDDLLAYALRFAESNDEPATGDCWAVIERARHYLRESANQDQSRETAPSVPASGAVPGIPSLEALCAGGLTIGECIRAFAVPGDDPYVSAARATIDADDDTEIDDHTTTSVGDGGAWVLAWLWISDAQAGVLSHSAMLEEVLLHARKALACAHGLDVETANCGRTRPTGWRTCCRTMPMKWMTSRRPGPSPSPVPSCGSMEKAAMCSSRRRMRCCTCSRWPDRLA